MDRLIVICEEGSQANHLAFLLGIPEIYVLPYINVKCIDLINPEAVGGFVTSIKPYPENVIELRQSLKNHLIGNKLINLEFDEFGICNELKLIYDEINNLFSKYIMKSQYNNSFELKSIENNLRKLFDYYGMTLEKGFNFDIVDTIHKPRLKPKTNPFKLFLKLINKYKYDQ